MIFHMVVSTENIFNSAQKSQVDMGNLIDICNIIFLELVTETALRTSNFSP